ncbi:MAG: hypothetical protein SGI84_04070 [Gemmatimonadota bacterium]|nr:hypothetical protein [Gemmatimonadota bacterium]
MHSLRRIAPGAYFVAALLFLITTVDYLGNAWPFLPGDISWRYGVVGMVSTYLLSPLLGCLIASATAAWLPQPRVSRVLGVVCWVVAGVLLTALGGFVLDSLQVRSAAAPDARWVTTTSFLLASAKIFLSVLALLTLGVGNLRAASAAAGESRSRKSNPARPIVGQS